MNENIKEDNRKTKLQEKRTYRDWRATKVTRTSNTGRVGDERVVINGKRLAKDGERLATTIASRILSDGEEAGIPSKSIEQRD